MRILEYFQAILGMVLPVGDSRLGVARWAAKWIKQMRSIDPQLSEAEIVQMALSARYEHFPLHPDARVTIESFRPGVSTVYDLCHLIAEAELLHHLNAYDRVTLTMDGKNIVTRTYEVIDQELLRLGFTPPTDSAPKSRASGI